MYGAFELKYTTTTEVESPKSTVDIKKKVMMATSGQAIELYKKVSERLLYVNCWNELSGMTGKQYRLFDNQGNVKTGKAEEGDYIRFDLPAPNLNGSKRYDWVRIERILCVKFGEKNSTAIRVQAAGDPKFRDAKMMEYYNGPTTNTFVVERQGNNVSVAIYPRNETPDTKQITGFYNKLHHVLSEFMAWMGVTDNQWNILIEGLLSSDCAKI